MSKFNWDFTLPESVIQLQDTLNRIETSALAISAIWEDAIPRFDFSELFAAAANIGKTFSIISDQAFQLTSIASSILSSVDTSMFASLANTKALTSALTDIDWSWLSEVCSKNGDDNADSTTTLKVEITPEIRAELASDITEVIAEPETMHLTSRNKYLEWVKKSPALAIQFVTLLFMLIQTICMMVQTWQARPVKDSQVYQEPTSTSNVVYNVTVENNLTIIDDVPYYYKVEFPNPETGELVTGYIYKGNLSEVTLDSTETSKPEETIPPSTESPTETTE